MDIKFPFHKTVLHYGVYQTSPSPTRLAALPPSAARPLLASVSLVLRDESDQPRHARLRALSAPPVFIVIAYFNDSPKKEREGMILL